MVPQNLLLGSFGVFLFMEVFMANVYCVDLIACLFYFDNILPEDLKNKSLNIREYISNEYQKIIKKTKSKQLKEIANDIYKVCFFMV